MIFVQKTGYQPLVLHLQRMLRHASLPSNLLSLTFASLPPIRPNSLRALSILLPSQTVQLRSVLFNNKPQIRWKSTLTPLPKLEHPSSADPLPEQAEELLSPIRGEDELTKARSIPIEQSESTPSTPSLESLDLATIIRKTIDVRPMPLSQSL